MKYYRLLGTAKAERESTWEVSVQVTLVIALVIVLLYLVIAVQ